MSPAASRRSRPARQVCPLCALDDDELVTWVPDAPGLWRFTCINHTPPHSWLTTGQGAFDETGSTGIADELGVYDDLLALFPEPGPFLEWGIVEHRYAHLRPGVYRELVDKYSHTALGPTQYSVSAFLGLAAGKLAREGHLALLWAPATGYWSYNGTISAFTLAPAADDAPLVSWAEYAVSEGFDPGDWPALGYRHGAGTMPRLVHEEAWQLSLGERWFSEDQLSRRGMCAWNHTAEDLVPATRMVVTEDSHGTQEARACCDECYVSVLRYVGRAGKRT
jgi:hypothetical protein